LALLAFGLFYPFGLWPLAIFTLLAFFTLGTFLPFALDPFDPCALLALLTLDPFSHPFLAIFSLLALGP